MNEKSVLISINPKWCELIATGKKTIEVRKTAPKLEIPFKCYIYCTQPKYPHEDFICIGAGTENARAFYAGEKVIGEFVCDDVIVVDCDSVNPFDARTGQYIDKETCLDRTAIWRYINGRSGYAWHKSDLVGWHISDLVIYDQPKELTEFFKYEKDTTIEALTEDETLCSYCSAYDYGSAKHWSSPTGGGFCEGSACKDAYRSYLEENFAITRPPLSWCYVRNTEEYW